MIRCEVSRVPCALAIVEGELTWRSQDSRLQTLLQSVHRVYHTPSGADPDPELTAAREVMTRLGGRITSLKDHKPPLFVRGQIY